MHLDFVPILLVHFFEQLVGLELVNKFPHSWLGLVDGVIRQGLKATGNALLRCLAVGGQAFNEFLIRIRS